MRNITNPNFIYIITFIVPFLVYSLEWSTIYPALTVQLFTFYFATFLVALAIGIVVSKLFKFKYKPIPVFPYNVPVIILLYIFYALDCAYMGFVPLFAFSSGEASYEAASFGIPTFHVLLITFTLFYALFLFHQFISTQKWSIFLLYISTILLFLFLLQRSNIMYIIIGSVFIYIISLNRISFKKVLALLAFTLSAIYFFGYLGNLRSANGDSTFIPRNSGVTEEFLESWVPNEFYWGYLYIGSPVANLQNNINMETNVNPNLGEFIIFEMTPDFLSKKVVNALSLTRREFYRINPFLNVGTIYARAFSYLSWFGMVMMFGYLIVLMNLYYIIIRKSYMFGATGLAMMFTMISFANFDNSIWFSAFSFPLFYPFLFSIVRGLKIKYKAELQQKTSLSPINTNLAT